MVKYCNVIPFMSDILSEYLMTLDSVGTYMAPELMTLDSVGGYMAPDVLFFCILLLFLFSWMFCSVYEPTLPQPFNLIFIACLRVYIIFICLWRSSLNITINRKLLNHANFYPQVCEIFSWWIRNWKVLIFEAYDQYIITIFRHNCPLLFTHISLSLWTKMLLLIYK